MKIRSGFVSNSSSSSYVCDVSGEAFEVSDGCFWDVGLCNCKAGHVFQKKFLVPWVPEYPSRDEMLAKLDSMTDSKRACEAFRVLKDHELKTKYAKFFMGGEGGYETNVNQCPICTLTNLGDDMLLNYVLGKTGGTRATLISEIKDEFVNYEAFQRFIKD